MSRWNDNWLGIDPLYRVLLYKFNQMKGNGLKGSKNSKLNAFSFFSYQKKQNKTKQNSEV